MKWARVNSYFQRSDLGYAVSASRAVDGWRYSAWGAPAEPDLSYWDWYAAHAQEHYPRGVAVIRRSMLLGVFETAAEARAACEQSTTLQLPVNDAA